MGRDGTGWDRMGRDGTGWDRMGQDENRALETAAKGYSRAVRLMITWSIVFLQLFFCWCVSWQNVHLPSISAWSYGHISSIDWITRAPNQLKPYPIAAMLTWAWYVPGKHGLNHIHVGPLWCIDHLPSGLHIHERVNPWSPHHLLCGIEDLVRQQQWLIRNCKVRMWLGAPDGNNAKEMMFLPGRRPSLRWTNI